MRKLTQKQKNYLINTFFSFNLSKNHNLVRGYPTIAGLLLEYGSCTVGGTTCIWFGGVGNFIKTSSEPTNYGCLTYTFDLENFLKSDYFKGTHANGIKELAANLLETKEHYEEIFAL